MFQNLLIIQLAMKIKFCDRGLFLLSFGLALYVDLLRQYDVLSVANDIGTLEICREELTIAALETFLGGGFGRKK